MATVKIDCLLFGYRRITVEEGKTGYATSLLLRARISARGTDLGSFYVRERDFQRACSLLRGRVRFEASDELGIPGVIGRIKCKWAWCVGSLLSALILFYLSGLVWDVRIEGNEKIPDSAVIMALSESGFYTGRRWRAVDMSAVENSVLGEHKEMSWLNINRRGSVAYVKVIENEYDGGDGDAGSAVGYANIVATTDCVIEEITVKCGIAEVKVGDVVKRGDVLISGVLPPESGGGFTSAEGYVRGVVSDTVSVAISRNYTDTAVIGKKIDRINVKLFNFSANIFKIYRNLGSKCDIIKDTDSFSLFGRATLPFRVTTEYRILTSVEEKEYTDEQLVSVALQELRMKLAAELAAADLISIRTDGEFIGDGYSMSSRVVYSTVVSERLEFEIEK